MKLSSFLLTLLGAVCVTAQQATTSNPVPVVALTSGTDGTGKRPNRLAIADLQSSGPAWDLYIQALAAFQAVPENNITSYFQVVGVHGLPYVPWNGVGANGGSGGYCPHNQILFATWHRPFLGLFEQMISAHAKLIASTYPSDKRSTYVAAAQTLRIPYWDWAVNPSLPSAATATQVTINSPTGSKTVRNPLYSYKFQKYPFTYSGFTGSIASYSQSLRCPSSTSSSASSRFSVCNSNLQRDASYLKNSVYLTFTRSNTFNTMASAGSGGYSFESPHNTVHNDVGCSSPSGHMTSLAWSSFDPIFMLHHANVDRLIAMWQAAHPDSPMFTGTQRTSSSMFGTPSGTSYTASSGLKPFYTSGGSSLWTSTGTTSTRAFGYTYPELQDWTMSSSDLQTYVIQQVNKLYGTSATVSKRSLRTRQDDTVTQYMAEISVDRKDLQLPSSINMYLGDTLAGTFTLLAMPTTGLSYGNIPLQDPLANFKANIAESAQDTVIRLLKTSLRVEMVTPDGATKSILNVPSLKVNLEVSKVQPPASASEFPKYLSTQKIQVALNDLVSN